MASRAEPDFVSQKDAHEPDCRWVSEVWNRAIFMYRMPIDSPGLANEPRLSKRCGNAPSLYAPAIEDAPGERSKSTHSAAEMRVEIE